MTIAQRQATIDRTFGLRKAELDCQAAQSKALATFLEAPDRAAHWNGMNTDSKRLIVSQRLSGLGYAVTEDELTHWLARYEEKYRNEVVTVG